MRLPLAIAILVMMLAGCGRGSKPRYAATPTAACLRNHGAHLFAVSSQPGLSGGVGFKLGGYTAGVFFFKNLADASQAFSFVRNNISLTLRNTPIAKRQRVKAAAESRNYLDGNTIVSWTSSKFEQVPRRLRNLLGSCLKPDASS